MIINLKIRYDRAPNVIVTFDLQNIKDIPLKYNISIPQAYYLMGKVLEPLGMKWIEQSTYVSLNPVDYEEISKNFIILNNEEKFITEHLNILTATKIYEEYQIANLFNKNYPINFSDSKRKNIYFELTFDLNHQEISLRYKNVSQAYNDLKDFLEKNGFKHELGSTYITNKKYSRNNIEIILSDLTKDMPQFKGTFNSATLSEIEKPLHLEADIINPTMHFTKDINDKILTIYKHKKEAQTSNEDIINDIFSVLSSNNQRFSKYTIYNQLIYLGAIEPKTRDEMFMWKQKERIILSQYPIDKAVTMLPGRKYDDCYKEAIELGIIKKEIQHYHLYPEDFIPGTRVFDNRFGQGQIFMKTSDGFSAYFKDSNTFYTYTQLDAENETVLMFNPESKENQKDIDFDFPEI